jgi:hypothetical protein
VPSRYSSCEQKLPWMTRELTSLKNYKTIASKKSQDSEKRCLKDDAIDNCECERLRDKFVSIREEYLSAAAWSIKSDPKTFFGFVDLKKKRVGYLSVMHFEAPRKSVICLRNLYNEHIPIMSGCLLILAQNTCRITHLLARSLKV